MGIGRPIASALELCAAPIWARRADLTLERLQGAAATLAEPSIPASAATRPDGHLATFIAEPSARSSTSLPSGTLTFLITEIEGSTQLWEQHPQAMPASPRAP